MAKVVSDEILKLKIVVNGDEAQKRIIDIEMANKKLSNSIDEERAKLQKLNYNKTKNREEIEKTKASIAKLTAEYDDNLRRIDEEIRGMNIMSLTTQQLKRRMDELSFTMRHMNPNNPNYKLAQDELAKLDSRYRQIRSGMGATAFSLKELSDKINQYSALITMAVIAITTMVVAIGKAIDINNKLADAHTAVSKTTGLHIDQVRELTEAFKEFDTRTSQLDLLKIAEIGGRLGVAQSEIKDFTREVDKVYVALGDGFKGGVEQVANSLGKLKGLYKETKDIPIAEAMNQIGSAINELGAAGAASEENITEFALRIGSLPDSMRPSISEALALGAAFEESGIDAERSGTAYANFVRIAAKSSAKFAEIMGKNKEEVDALINSNPMEFFLQFAEGAKGLEATELAKILDDLKMNDQFVSAILTSASDNMDRFRKSINLSNEELKKATSLQNEFDKVNNNAAAIYDKIKKKFEQMYTSETVAKTLNWLVEKFGQLIGAIEDTEGSMTTFRNVLFSIIKVTTIVIASLLSYRVAIALTALMTNNAITATKLWSIVLRTAGVSLNTQRNATILAALAKAVFTGNTTRAAAALRLFNQSVKVSPIGIFIALITAASTAIYFFSERADKAAESQKKLNDLKVESDKSLKNEMQTMQSLLAIAKDENASKNARIEAIKKLNQLSPEYIGNLTLENINTKAATKAVEDYTKSLYRNAKAKLLQKQYEQAVEEYDNDVRKEMSAGYFDGTPIAGEKLMDNQFKQYNDWIKRFGKEKATELMKQYSWLYDERNQGAKGSLSKLNELSNQMAESLKEDLGAATPTSKYKSPGGGSGGSSGGKTAKSASKGTKGSGSAGKSQYQKDLEEMLKLSEQYGQKNLDLASEFEKRKIEMMEDGFEKEKLLLEVETEEKIRNYENQKISAKEMAKLDDLIKKTKNKKLKTRLEEERYKWKEHNNRLTALQFQETDIQLTKLNTLRQKYIQEFYKKEEDALEKRLELFEREKNEKLALSMEEQKNFLAGMGYTQENLDKIKTWEESRKEIENFYQNKRPNEQLAFLKLKVEEFNVLATISPFFITPEQLKTIEEYKNKIAALVAEIAKLKNKDGAEDGKSLGGRLEGVGSGGSTDILGLTPDQWEAMFTNTENLTENIQKVTAAVVVLQNAFGAYAQFAKANEDAMLQKFQYASEAKRKRLDNQLNAGIISQQEYKHRVAELEQELDKKKAQIAYNQAKRERTIAIAQTIANTAASIVQLWVKPGFPMAIPLTAMVAAIGGLQLKTIMSQPLPEAPGAEDGLYPVIREQDGKLFSARRRRSRSGVYNEPTLLVGEGGRNMPELVVSGPDLKRIDPEITRMFMRDIDRVRGFEKGMYPSAPTTVSSNNDEMMIKMMALMSKNIEVLEHLRDTPPIAIIKKDARNGKEVDEMRQEYLNLKNKNKHGGSNN